MIVKTSGAPSPIGPYSQAVRHGELLFLSGQISLLPDSGEMVQGDIAAETRQVMENLGAVLKEAAMGFSQVLKTTIFLTDLRLFPQVNEAYGKFFQGDFPARETVEVSALPKGARVEISMIAGS